MIHYHGTPVGGTREQVARFLNGRHAFVSYARPEDLPVAAEVCESFAIDNGAFTSWKSGATFNPEAYTKWVVDEWSRHPALDFAVIPDVIDGTEEENDALIREWPRWKAEGSPVWHLHESLDRLHRLTMKGNGWKAVCIGSSGRWSQPGTDAWWHRIREAMSFICDENGRPPCRLHGLRMLNPGIFTRIPLASADSTNAVRNANLVKRFGIYCPPTHAQRLEVIASRIEAFQSPAVWRDANAEREQLLLIG